jgi:putative ribosome biogenesis GTPase RsgA
MGDGRGDRLELLCTVRGLLKKIKQSVLVGDRVRVAAIDWEDRRGEGPTGRYYLTCCARFCGRRCYHYTK